MQDASVSPRVARTGGSGPLACRMCGSRELVPAGEVDGYDFVECAACAFTFAPAITPESMASLYREGYHGPAEGAPETGWAKPRFLEPALERLSPDGRPLSILDFGTGQSRIPEALREAGHHVVAVDVAPPLRPHPDRLTGDLLELALPQEGFDLSYSYQVFEHLPEPVPYLRRLLELTRPGGLVLVHTDMEMPERDAGGFPEWWYVLPPDHCVFFRHRTFERFLEDTPHEIVWRSPKVVLIRVGG